ncbi:ATP-binding cassette sub-family B member 6-like isoform X2 [Cylas formicarius]|uniref:ATP-binding cassette sub-family B member 6-like isoform X2 n=1 Tax=Cylas formicarius TaxID=197179 RepID=UPI002958A900|nr:ATP-binding cassette sub-family B member 6-like isoform X2 [Cylas formicarius]
MTIYNRKSKKSDGEEDETLSRRNLGLQVRVLLCFAILGAERLANLYVPIYSKLIVDSLTPQDGTTRSLRWDLILIYTALRSCAGIGYSGIFNSLASFLWSPLEHYVRKQVQVSLFRHIHSLSLRWHLEKKTGEVLRTMDRSGDTINMLLYVVFFVIVPVVSDLLVAINFFCQLFNFAVGLIIFAAMIVFVGLNMVFMEWYSKFQKNIVEEDNEANSSNVDSLLNFETVKYYCAEAHEVDKFERALTKSQASQWKSYLVILVADSTESLIFFWIFLAGCLFAANRVVTLPDQMTVGDYVLFTSYLVQLSRPLSSCSGIHRQMQYVCTSLDGMFQLFNQEPEVIDAIEAVPLAAGGGEVAFNNVTFGYNEDRIILKNVSFVVPAGKTVALVGPSGSGKSTIIRLLFRFYDVNGGSVLIDGQNIKGVTQVSLRKIIGVVPQDTVLFNETVKYNVKYGRFGASDEEMIAATNAADIHDRIMTFPEAYGTIVGERGLRLSGGEKQRVAIARTLLKAPEIVLLDEATSSLDTHAERNIQASLGKLCEHRTTLIVAHRLSTVIHADEILVLKDGEIVERGRHSELIEKEGFYCDMWKRQLNSGLD